MPYRWDVKDLNGWCTLKHLDKECNHSTSINSIIPNIQEGQLWAQMFATFCHSIHKRPRSLVEGTSRNTLLFPIFSNTHKSVLTWASECVWLDTTLVLNLFCLASTWTTFFRNRNLLLVWYLTSIIQILSNEGPFPRVTCPYLWLIKYKIKVLEICCTLFKILETKLVI